MLLTFFFVFLKSHLDVYSCLPACCLVARRQRSEHDCGSLKLILSVFALMLFYFILFQYFISYLFLRLFHTSFSIEMRKEGKCVSLNVLFSSLSFLQIFAFCFPFLFNIQRDAVMKYYKNAVIEKFFFREICFVYRETFVAGKKGLGLTGKKLYSN